MKTFKIRSLVFSLLALTVTGYAQNTVLLNKGHLFVNDTLYIGGSILAEDSSKIAQKGHTIVTGDLVNDVTTGHVFTETKADNTGSFEFKGNAAQTIRGTASKSANFINFPTKLIINNQAALTVTLKADKSATAQNIDVQNGRLIIDSEPVASTRETNNAHLLVEGTASKGIQVNLAMGDNYLSGHVAGFTSPFKTLYADYFFFNFLTRPSNVGLFGDSKQLITNPRTALKPGVGYLIGLGVIPDGSPYYTEERDPRWSDADPTKRAKDMFRFSRSIAEKSFNKYMSEAVAPGFEDDEVLNTGNVAVNLKTGFNYLGNPYTAPLDLTDIVEQTTSGSWGAPDGKLKNGFYVLTNGKGTTTDNATYEFTASYLKKQKVGSTAPNPSPYSPNVVAPMQMFIVWADNDLTLTIPAGKRKHETVSYLRSTASEPTDELLIETTDMETGGFDRLCIVFRENTSLSAGDFYDAPKFFNLSGGVNQIYTRSSDDKKLSISVVPTSTDELPMYFEPASKAQMVTLKASRLESLVSVSGAVLVDTKTGAKVNLLQTPEYTFTSSPSDKPDRFVLRFSTTTTGVEDITPTNVYASYNDGAILVYGLQESDLGSTIALYSMNGQQLYGSQVREVSPCRIQKDLLKGVYLLKTNKRSLKLIVP